MLAQVNFCSFCFVTFRAVDTFDIDVRQLEAKYKSLQKDLHPDKFGQCGAKQQEYSAEHSSLVNHAYVKLKSPLQRALYLVSRCHATLHLPSSSQHLTNMTVMMYALLHQSCKFRC